MSADLPTPDRPGMNTTTERPALAASNAVVNARRCVSRPIKAGPCASATFGVETIEGLCPLTRRNTSGPLGRLAGSGSSSSMLRARRSGATDASIWQRWRVLLGVHHFHRGTRERQTTSQRLVQHHSDAVPIAGR